MKQYRCIKCGHLTNPFVATFGEDRIASCYARINPKTNEWMWGCTRPTNSWLDRFIIKLIGKRVTDAQDLLDSD